MYICMYSFEELGRCAHKKEICNMEILKSQLATECIGLKHDRADISEYGAHIVVCSGAPPSQTRAN